MNVLLVSSFRLPGLKASRATFPVAALHLAAALRQAGHAPRVCDLSTVAGADGPDPCGAWWQALRAAIEAHVPGLVGFSCFSSMHFPMVRELARRVKEAAPEAVVCVGGSHPSYFPTELLRHCPELDLVVIGEGEEQVVAIADGLSAGDRAWHARTQALGWRTRAGHVRVRPRERYADDLATRPLPAYDLVRFADYEAPHPTWHNPKGHDIRLAVPILTSRSCPCSCTFCSAHTMMGKRHRLRDPGQVVDEVELLVEEHGQRYFTFVDDNVNLSRRHFVAVCDGIRRRGLDVQLCVPQGLCLNTVDRELVEAFVAAGGVTVSLPIESGSDFIRNDVARKNLSLDTIVEVTRLVRDHGLFTVGLFIMGFPEDTAETLEETLSLIERLKLDVNAVSTLVPFPGTAVYEQARREGLLRFDTEELWKGEVFFDPQNKEQVFVEPVGLGVDELLRFRARFEELYLFSDYARSLNQAWA